MIRHISSSAWTVPEWAADRNAVTEPSKSYAPPSGEFLQAIQGRQFQLILAYTGIAEQPFCPLGRLTGIPAVASVSVSIDFCSHLNDNIGDSLTGATLDGSNRLA